MKRRTECTVIMRTKNSAGILEQTLKALFSQSYKNFELQIVDSSSTDATLSIAARFPCQVHTIKAQDYFPGKVLNAAVERARTPLVVFLNSDAVLLTDTALEKLLEPFKEQSVQASFARQVPRPDAEPWVSEDYARAFPANGVPPPWITLSLPFAAMRKRAWERRPFYTWAWGSEDSEWGHWARENGVEVRYVPESLVMHSENYKIRQLYGRRFIEGEADAYIYRSSSHHFLHMLARVAKSCSRDALSYIRSGDVLGLARVPLRRWVDHWAYYRGYRWGRVRLANGDSDASVGQDTVLQRYQ